MGRKVKKKRQGTKKGVDKLNISQNKRLASTVVVVIVVIVVVVIVELLLLYTYCLRNDEEFLRTVTKFIIYIVPTQYT